jgi:hypothetical protein
MARDGCIGHIGDINNAEVFSRCEMHLQRSESGDDPLRPDPPRRPPSAARRPGQAPSGFYHRPFSDEAACCDARYSLVACRAAIIAKTPDEFETEFPSYFSPSRRMADCSATGTDISKTVCT